MDEFPFSALFLFAQSCLTDAVNVIFSDYCFTDTYLIPGGVLLLYLLYARYTQMKAYISGSIPSTGWPFSVR